MKGLVRLAGAQLLLCAILTAVAGEFRITPFSGDVFRIGLGTSAFLLCLLLMRQLTAVRAGLVTAVCVLLFRTGLDAVRGPGIEGWEISLRSHCSAAVYYVVFALLLGLIQSRWRERHPLLLGGFISGVDFVANEAELLCRALLTHTPMMGFEQWMLLAGTAVVRSYFVVGVYSSIKISQVRTLQREQQKRMEQMLNVGSGLYGEVFYLRKSMNAIEAITARSYQLYSRMAESGMKDASRSVLEITQQIHELKKDSQRILAGLLKLFDRETAAAMKLTEIADFVIKSNKEYAQMLNKTILFEKDIAVDYVTERYIPLITVLNNLVSNAVEAVEKRGIVEIRIEESGEHTVIVVSDDGPGVAEQDREMIFEPGFTTKYSQAGYAATGIGLSHVRDIAVSFGGALQLVPSPKRRGAAFSVSLPTVRIQERG